MKRAGLVILLLAGVYTMTLASFHPLDLLFGVVASVAALYTYRGFVFGAVEDRTDQLPGLLVRCVAFFPFAVAVVWDVVKGTSEVALVVLHLRPLVRPGIVNLTLTRLNILKQPATPDRNSWLT